MKRTKMYKRGWARLIINKINFNALNNRTKYYCSSGADPVN